VAINLQEKRLSCCGQPVRFTMAQKLSFLPRSNGCPHESAAHHAHHHGHSHHYNKEDWYFHYSQPL